MPIPDSQRKELRVFLQDSFTIEQMDCFLDDLDYSRIRRSLRRRSEDEYFIDLVAEFDRHGVIDITLFDKLVEERPSKQKRILELKDLILGPDLHER